jgi:hypothetical protein
MNSRERKEIFVVVVEKAHPSRPATPKRRVTKEISKAVMRLPLGGIETIETTRMQFVCTALW